MIFGDPKRFAIEAKRQQAVEGKWLFGFVWFVIDEISVGNFDEVTLLDATSSTFSSILRRTYPRQADRLVLLDAVDLITFAKKGFDINSYHPSGLYDEAYKYVIAPNGDPAFDGWLVLFVQGADYDRVIWHQASSYGQAFLNKGECYSVLESFIAWIKTLS